MKNECICCFGSGPLNSKSLCSKGCSYNFCAPCLIKNSHVEGLGTSLDNIYSKCFICREKIYIGIHLDKILKRRKQFMTRIGHAHPSSHRKFIIFKDSISGFIGISEVMEEKRDQEYISHATLNYAPLYHQFVGIIL